MAAALAWVAVIFISVPCCEAVEILNIRHWTAPDHTRVVLDVSGEPDYELKEGDNLLIVNFKKSSLHKSIPAVFVINKPGIKSVHFYSLDEDTILAQFILDHHRKAEVFKLKKFQDKPDRLVVDIFLKQASREEKSPEKNYALKKKKIIVIDPGHGGEDPGAVGKNGTYEKDIVLAISREIKKVINQMPGYRAYLTRDGDYYVSFRQRLQKAKKLGASLFISIHADAAKTRSAKGSSVYCLSTGAASSEAARLLARNENLSDILGGVPDSEGSNESNQIIMNMFQTDTINLSKIYAGILMQQLDALNCLKYKTPQEAPFRVLKLPDIPAVLVETAFISNAQEEQLLKKPGFQKKLALAISSSIQDFLSTGAEGPDREISVATTEYIIKKGDTLFAIAKNFNTSIDVLLKLNAITLNDPILVGQRMNVPSKENKKAEPDKKRFKLYTVQKGDTLFIVAKKHSTTLAHLLKINGMDIKDPLFYGKRIKVPLSN